MSKYKWYKAEGKLIRPWLRSKIEFYFWIGAENKTQAKQRIKANFKGKRETFVLETLSEDSGPPGNEK